jgi:hypothetical protein
LDAAIFSEDWNTLLFIVEFKRPGSRRGYGQVKRYQQLGVPVALVASLDFVDTINAILESEHPGVEWSKVLDMDIPDWRPLSRRPGSPRLAISPVPA